MKMGAKFELYVFRLGLDVFQKKKLLEKNKVTEKKAKGKIKQGRIHGNPVADGWAGAVMPKPLAIQKYFRQTDGRTDGRTDRHGKV